MAFLVVACVYKIWKSLKASVMIIISDDIDDDHDDDDDDNDDDENDDDDFIPAKTSMFYVIKIHTTGNYNLSVLIISQITYFKLFSYNLIFLNRKLTYNYLWCARVWYTRKAAIQKGYIHRRNPNVLV